MKYFYSDLLAAAWMAREFGMRFHNNEPFSMTYHPKDLVNDTDCYFRIKCGNTVMGKFYVHKDSLYLFSIKLGDTIQFRDKFHCIYEREITDDEETKKQGVGVYKKILISSEDIGRPTLFWPLDSMERTGESLKIIQRNGAAFMWPECEE